MIYVCLPALNITERQGRVTGHRFTPASREELKKLAALAPRLTELRVERIICSDLDGQSGAALARRLNVPVEEWQSLRRFNWGKLQSTNSCKAREVYESVQSHEVPIKGGDSRTSFGKRIAASAERLRRTPSTINILVIVDGMVLEALSGASGADRYRIYELKLKEEADGPEQQHEAASVSASAATR